MKLHNKTLVLTGGGSGIGRALCLALLDRGARVAIADVNEAGMEETRKLAGNKAGQLSLHKLNIADRQAVEGFAQSLIAQYGTVEGIINNAGIIQPFVKVNELDYEKMERIMNINFYGTLHMVKAFLPHLLSRSEAHIVNVASMGAFIPFPGQTLYGASKAAVKLLTEGLYAELMDSPVRVTLVMPGAVNTNISANSGVTMRGNASASEAKMQPLAPEKAAVIILDAVERDELHVLVGSDARFLNFYYRLSPGRAIRFIVNKMKGLM